MARRKKIIGSILIVILVTAGTVFWRVSRSGPALVSVDSNIKLVEKPCDKALLPGRCGVVIVPLDYDNPGGKTIETGFVYYPAIGFSSETLQLVGGGPGDAITGVLKKGGRATLIGIRAMLYSRALLFIEPRGLALSTQLNCKALSRMVDAASSNRPARQRCADEIGQDTDYFTTENSARDFDRVRQSLGINELDLYGFSYGSNLTAVYASLFPAHIRTLGLDGAFPLKTWDMFMPTHYAAMNRMVKQFCERSNECKSDEVMQAMTWATQELRKAPRDLKAYAKSDSIYDGPIKLDAETLAGMMSSIPASNVDEKTGFKTWRRPLISALLKAYKQKNWTALDTVVADELGFKKSLLKPLTSDNSYALSMVISCQDWRVPWKRTSTYDQRLIEYKVNAADYERKHPSAFAPFTAQEWGMRRGSNGYYEGIINCPVQKVALPSQSDTAYDLPQSLPVLVVNAEYDFQTVMEDAEVAKGQFENAQFAHYKNYGHAVLPKSICAFGMLREFLANKRVADPNRCYNDGEVKVSIQAGKAKP